MPGSRPSFERLGIRHSGVIEQPHVYPWSTVSGCPPTPGTSGSRPTTTLAARERGRRAAGAEVPSRAAAAGPAARPRLAPDGRRGQRLRALSPREATSTTGSRCCRVRRRAAGMEGTSTPCWRSASRTGGCHVAAAYERLMDEIDAEERFRDATAQVDELCDELAAYGIRETLQHDDLHDGQVFVRTAAAPHGLGGRLHLAPVLHAVGDPRGGAVVGSRRRRGLRRHRRRSGTPTSRRTPRGTTATWSRPPTRPAAGLGLQGRQRPRAGRRQRRSPG